MRIVTHGCSFTKYKWACWPNFISWFENATVENHGEVGSANETIARKVLETSNKSVDHVYIMWSATDRYEVMLQNGNIKTGGHPVKTHHDYYVRNFLNEEQNMYRTLEKILLVQLFLNSKNIPYTMMIWKGDILSKKYAIHNDIDWGKFKFYKQDQGLWEFAQDNYKQYYIPGESHPPPIAHYHWVKDIIFQSDVKCPDAEYRKLKQWKI